MKDMEMQDLKMKEQMSGHENTGPEKSDPGTTRSQDKPTCTREKNKNVIDFDVVLLVSSLLTILGGKISQELNN